MNTFLKISLGFVLGVICTIGVFSIIIGTKNTDEYKQRNIQSFEITTNKGIIKLHTYMLKDSVMILMGRPQSTDINDNRYNEEVHEIWKYKGSNKYTDEFTIEFINGKLKSVRQYKE